MMKKLIVLAVVAMVFGMVSGAYASATDWLLYLKASDLTGANYITTGALFGTKTGALDGADANDASNVAGTGSAACVGGFDLGDGAATNGWSKDLRAPGTANLTWNIKVWVQPAYAGTEFKLTGWNPTGTYDMPVFAQPMELKIGGNSFIFDGSANGTSTAPMFTWTFGAADVKGVGNALTGTFAPVIPEPGSILALASGLVGLVGFGIRRRK